MFWFGFVVGGFIIGTIGLAIGMSFGRVCMQNENLKKKLNLYKKTINNKTKITYNPTDGAWRNN